MYYKKEENSGEIRIVGGEEGPSEQNNGLLSIECHYVPTSGNATRVTLRIVIHRNSLIPNYLHSQYGIGNTSVNNMMDDVQSISITIAGTRTVQNTCRYVTSSSD